MLQGDRQEAQGVLLSLRKRSLRPCERKRSKSIRGCRAGSGGRAPSAGGNATLFHLSLRKQGLSVTDASSMVQTQLPRVRQRPRCVHYRRHEIRVRRHVFSHGHPRPCGVAPILTCPPPFHPFTAVLLKAGARPPFKCAIVDFSFSSEISTPSRRFKCAIEAQTQWTFPPTFSFPVHGVFLLGKHKLICESISYCSSFSTRSRFI